MTWDGAVADWWRAEVAADLAYVRDVDPLLATLLEGLAGPSLDLGCGEGRLLGRHGAVGVDVSLDLARQAAERAPTAVADVRCLPFADGKWESAYAVLVLEHLEEVGGFFAETARVVAGGGALAVVLNHPVYTAPGSGPFVDPDDGEVLWRWGSYLSAGRSTEPAGETSVVFHHRPLQELLNAAAMSGWALDLLLERALTPAGDPLLAAQIEVPRLLGIRWRR